MKSNGHALITILYYNNIRDPDGECPMCIGFAIGFLVDAALQTIEISLDDSKTMDDFSWTQAGISGLAGATGVGLTTKLKNATTITKLAVEVTTDASFSAASQYAEDGEVSIKDVALDVAGGQTIGKMAGDVAETKFLDSKKGKNLQESVNRQKNIERGKSNTIPKRKADVTSAENKLTSESAARGIGASTSASGVTSTVYNKATESMNNSGSNSTRLRQNRVRDERSMNVRATDNTSVRSYKMKF